MKSNTFTTSFIDSDINPNKWTTHKDNKFKLVVALELNEVTIKNPPKYRSYFIYFEKYPEIKMEATSMVLNEDFNKVFSCILRKLSKEIENKMEEIK